MNRYPDHSPARYLASYPACYPASQSAGCYPVRLPARCSVARSPGQANCYSTLRHRPDPICHRVADPGRTLDGDHAPATVRDHDASYKLVFSFREVVRDLIHGFIGNPWLRSLDWNSLEPVSANYVSDRLRRGINDVVWRINVPGQDQPLYLLIEFQSRNDADMAARMLAYVGMFYRDASRRRDRRRGQSYPPVLPIVLYSGNTRWRASTEIATMISAVPQSMASHQPRLNYCLIDRTRYTDAELAAKRNLVAVLMRFERAESIEAMLEPLRLARELTAHNAALDEAMTAWFAALTPNALHLTEVHNLMEFEMEMSARFHRWAREYAKKEVEKGIEKGGSHRQGRSAAKGPAASFRPIVHTRCRQAGGRLNGSTGRLAGPGIGGGVPG
ncbi:Transposase (putative) YhgA-like domain-containing protein [Cupriavidus sp. H18C1]